VVLYSLMFMMSCWFCHDGHLTNEVVSVFLMIVNSGKTASF
jgi:hypothetical protein